MNATPVAGDMTGDIQRLNVEGKSTKVWRAPCIDGSYTETLWCISRKKHRNAKELALGISNGTRAAPLSIPVLVADDAALPLVGGWNTLNSRCDDTQALHTFMGSSPFGLSLILPF